MIISGGENVYPAEIENVLMAHDGIKEAAVIGQPSEKWGESPFAIVVRKDDALKEKDVIEFCRGRLAGFKQPRGVAFVDEIPRNPERQDFETCFARSVSRPSGRLEGAFNGTARTRASDLCRFVMRTTTIRTRAYSTFTRCPVTRASRTASMSKVAATSMAGSSACRRRTCSGKAQPTCCVRSRCSMRSTARACRIAACAGRVPIRDGSAVRTSSCRNCRAMCCVSARTNGVRRSTATVLHDLGNQAMTALANIHRIDWRTRTPYLGEPIPFEDDVVRWDRFYERAADPERLALGAAGSPATARSAAEGRAGRRVSR